VGNTEASKDDASVIAVAVAVVAAVVVVVFVFVAGAVLRSRAAV
jgi:hypothetical protein